MSRVWRSRGGHAAKPDGEYHCSARSFHTLDLRHPLAPNVDQKARDQSVRDPTTRGWRKVEASSLVGRIKGPWRTVSNLAGASISHCNNVLDADRI